MVYIFLEKLNGGDLMKVLGKFTKIEPDFAKFYIAQILIAFEYLHG